MFLRGGGGGDNPMRTMDLCTYDLLVIFFQAKVKKRKTVLSLFLCLIHKSGICNLFFYNIIYIDLCCYVSCQLTCNGIIANLNS